MKPLEIIIGAVVLLISIVLIVICMMQEQKPQNATAALTGASNDSFYDKNRGRTKEARLKKITVYGYRNAAADEVMAARPVLYVFSVPERH